MGYHMEIKSTESVNCFNVDLRQDIIVQVGCKYVYSVKNPTNKKDRKDNGRKVEILGFSDSFMGDAIVRYLDNKRRGKLKCNHLLPCDEPDDESYVVTFYSYD